MSRPVLPFLICLGAVALATVAGLTATRAATNRFVRAGHEERARLEALRISHESDAAKRSAAANAAALTQAAAWQSETDHLTRELADLRRALEAGPTAPPNASPAVSRSALAAAPKSVNPWENVGRAAPIAAFQTVQWAIHAGDVDTLEAAIALDATAQQAADAFFASLDPRSQAEFGSPRRLVASAMAAKSRSSLSSAEVLSETATPGGPTEVRLRVAGERMRTRDITMRFQASSDGWKLEVPAKIVTSYRNLLLGPVVDPETYKVIR